ncbi:MAG: hypothetical protein ACRDLO_15955 [Solirubrobacterales bacterium]
MTRRVKISGRTFDLDRERVTRALAGTLPEPLNDHFVVIDGRRWPPKQVIGLATGLDRADFTTHQARRILVRLGFPASRRSTAKGAGALGPAGTGARGGLADALRPFIGSWVAIRGGEVLVAAPSASEVVAWLARHEQRADSMFRVPGDEGEAGGAAPA